MTAANELPLAGIRVIDFTQVMMGPVATQIGHAILGVDIGPIDHRPIAHVPRVVMSIGNSHAPAAEMHGVNAALVEQHGDVLERRGIECDEVGCATGFERTDQTAIGEERLPADISSPASASSW